MIARVPPAPAFEDLVARVQCDGYEGRPSVLTGIVARLFVRRLLELAVRPASVGDALAWVASLHCEPAVDERVYRMLAFACDVVPLDATCDESAVAMIAVREALAGGLVARIASHASEAPADDGLDSVIGGFVLRLDAADALSAEHSRAVSLWCARLAKRLDLPADEATYVTRSGLLHDVGKSATPSEILNAARSLTEDEWLVMRDHTRAGAALVRDVEALCRFEPAVRWHHERLDGRGYPDRLSGDDIPLAVRIVSVADSFNAMIGRRPYRLPLSPAVALGQLVTHRETQFDPLVVEAMIDVIDHP